MTHRVTTPATTIGLPDRDGRGRGGARRFKIGRDDVFADLLDQLDRIAALPVKVEGRH